MSILSEYDEIDMNEKHRRHLTRLDINLSMPSFSMIFSGSDAVICSGAIIDAGIVQAGIYLIVGPFPDKNSIRCWGYCGDMMISHADQICNYKYRINVEKQDLKLLIENLGPGSWVRIIADGHKIPNPWEY